MKGKYGKILTISFLDKEYIDVHCTCKFHEGLNVFKTKLEKGFN